MRRMTMLLGLAVLGTALGGCNDTAKQNEQSLLNENRNLRDRLDQARSDLQTAQDENSRLQFQLEESSARMADVSAQPPAGVSEFGPGVEVFQRGNETIVRIEGDVLFDSGRNTLKPDAKKTLGRIASKIEEMYPNANIRVAGHTDTDPIKKSGHKTNYHLGFERAYAVGQYLGSHGIQPDRISYASYGPHDPLGSKSKSRRVEVSVMNDD